MTESQRKTRKDKADKKKEKDKDSDKKPVSKAEKQTRADLHLSMFHPRVATANDATEARMRQAVVPPAVDADGQVEDSLIESRTVKLEESEKARKGEDDEAEPVPPPKRVSVAGEPSWVYGQG